MKYLTRLFAAGFVACALCATVCVAQRKPRDPALEAPYVEALQKVAPAMVDKFKAATAAVDAGKFEDAAKLYREILVKAPNFEPALRRLSYCLLGLGQRDEALRYSKQAVDRNRSHENLFTHAANLVAADFGNYQPTDSEIRTALDYASEARKRNTDESDPMYAFLEADLALAAGDNEHFDTVVREMLDRFPRVGETHYYNAIRLGNSGELAGAEAEVIWTERQGVAKERTQPLLADIRKARLDVANNRGPTGESSFGLGEYSFIGKYLGYAAMVVGVWVVGLLALFGAGKLLSARTMNLLHTADPNDMSDGRHAGPRRAYRAVISLAGVYYFISQPVVALLVILFTLGVMLFFFYIGWLPIKLMLIVAFIGAASIFYMLKTLFVRAKQEDPGRLLTEAEAPALWATVREVAATIKTRPVTEIRLTIGTDVAVYERGGIRQRLRDQGERVLILGVAGLNDFPQSAFRAVLAHEYGHFSHRDTAGGDVALKVNEHIFRVAQAMAESGTATVYNLAFQFLRLYHFLFRRITHGATRLQEVMADRVAVYHYGAEAFRTGLTHVIRREIEFTSLSDAEINAARADSRVMQNLYELKPEGETHVKELEALVAEAIARETTEDDTHPSPKERFELAAKIRSLPNFPVRGVVWDLFTDREALTAEMNKLIAGLVGAKLN